MTDEKTAEVSQPSEGPFYFPTFAIASQRSAIVERRLLAALAMWRDQKNAAFEQAPAQRIAVVTSIGDHAQWPVARATARLRHRNLFQGALGERDFRWAGRGQLASQRNTRAVDHHHPLCALATLGLADALAPFFAGAKLASRKLSSQSSVPRASSSERKARQILSHTPCFSHRANRRQQVAGLGYSSGKSRQRAPVLSTQRMPSSTCRLSAHGRPRLFSTGSKGSIFCHCASDRNAFRIPSFS